MAIAVSVVVGIICAVVIIAAAAIGVGGVVVIDVGSSAGADATGKRRAWGAGGRGVGAER